MGRKKTFVGTQIDRVIPDDKLPNSVRKGLTKALFEGGDVVDYVLEEMITNIGVRAERLYSFAEQGNYVHGLPSGEFKLPATTVLQTTKIALQILHGSLLQMQYVNYGPPNNLHIAWMKLIADHGYDPVTNILGGLTASMGKTFYLEDMVVVLPATMLNGVESRSLEQWGIAPRAGRTPERIAGSLETRAMVTHTPPLVDATATSEYVRVWYAYKDETGDVLKGYFDITISGYDDDADYFHACYYLNGESGNLRYWMYRAGAGTFPTLDSLFDSTVTPETNGEFFPFLYFRHNKVSEISNKTTESYRDSVKLAKYLGMDYDQVAETVDQNPGIADVDQAVIMFAVPASSQVEEERKYLWDFFHQLYLAQGESQRFQTEAQFDIASSQLFGADIQPPGIVIQDKRFKMSLSNQGIYKISKMGNIAEIGKHLSGVSTFNVTNTYQDINYETGTTVTYDVTTPVTYHYYRRQVTASLYEELQVVGLQTRFFINGDYSTIGDENNDKILLIPLDHSITKEYPIPAREVLYARSLHYVFNSFQVIKLKWYQTGLFKTILTIVAIVITVWSFGADGGSSIATVLAAGSYSVALELIVMKLIEFLVAKLIFKLFVKAVGAQSAFALAIVLAVVGAAMGFTSTEGLAGTPWAKDLLSLASGIAQSVNDQVSSMMTDLAADFSQFDQYVKEQLKLLDAAQDLLEHNQYLSPFVIFGEKPDDFYNRTVHSGNIGVVAIEAISSFVDMKLTLPNLEDTLGRGIQEGDWKQ